MANVVEMNTNDRVMPVRLTDEKSGKVYELDFNREAVRFAEARGFKVNSIADFPATAIPELFYLSFRAHHKNVSRSHGRHECTAHRPSQSALCAGCADERDCR